MCSENNPFQEPLTGALAHALRFLDGLNAMPVAATADLQTLRRQLHKSLQDDGIQPQAVIDELVRDTHGGLLGSAGGRFFGWVLGGSVPAALAADWLTATWDQNAALYACSPAAAVAEEVAGEWLKDLLRLPSQASFALTTGCQTAHLTCLAAARHAVLGARGWDVEGDGLSGAPPVRVLCSSARHGSVARAVRLLGIGERQLINLPADESGTLHPDVLSAELEAHPGRPTIVVLQAGEINTGSFDRFDSLIPIAKHHRAWVHVDGAFGLWAAASDRYRHFLHGAERADSWATDGHKWLNVPYDCGYAFVADRAAHRDSMSSHAAYITHNPESRDEMDWNIEWSRRARGFATYAAIREMGRNGIADLIDRCCEHARTLVTEIGKLRGAVMVSEPTLNQGLVRFVSDGSTDAGNDQRTEEVVARVLETGEAFFTATSWQGRRAMRVSVCGWQTSRSDVERAVAAISSVLSSPPAEAP